MTTKQAIEAVLTGKREADARPGDHRRSPNTTPTTTPFGLGREGHTRP
jgi:hypothetical protein